VAALVYESIKQPEESDLIEYETSKHISHFFCNPWFQVFIGLRDLVSIGNTATIKANTNASNSIPLKDRADAQRKLENMTEQLLHRFMETTLVLFSIICNERDAFRRYVIVAVCISVSVHNNKIALLPVQEDPLKSVPVTAR
jgi:hypothetical protein